MRKLSTQIPEAERSTTLSAIDAALKELHEAVPAAELSEADRQIILRHLERLQATEEAVRQSFEQAPLAVSL